MEMKQLHTMTEPINNHTPWQSHPQNTSNKQRPSLLESPDHE